MNCPKCKKPGYSPKIGRPMKMDTKKAMALKKAGWSITKIADFFKVSRVTVYSTLAKKAE